jgi:hypothetical protein
LTTPKKHPLVLIFVQFCIFWEERHNSLNQGFLWINDVLCFIFQLNVPNNLEKRYKWCFFSETIAAGPKLQKNNIIFRSQFLNSSLIILEKKTNYKFAEVDQY